MSAPDIKLTIKRKILDRNGKPIWLPVGDITLWSKDGTLSGRLRMNVFDSEFHVFEKIPEGAEHPKGRPAFRGEPAEQDTEFPY